jgi:hypothetical protein
MRPALLVTLSLVAIVGATWIGGAALTADHRRARALAFDPLRPRRATGARVMEYALVLGFVALVIVVWAMGRPRAAGPAAAAPDVGAADRTLTRAMLAPPSTGR